MTDLLKLSDAIVLEYLQSKDKNLAKVFQQKTKAVSVNARRQVQRVRFGCTENGAICMRRAGPGCRSPDRSIGSLLTRPPVIPIRLRDHVFANQQHFPLSNPQASVAKNTPKLSEILQFYQTKSTTKIPAIKATAADSSDDSDSD